MYIPSQQHKDLNQSKVICIKFTSQIMIKTIIIFSQD